METITIPGFIAFTLAIVLLFLGKGLTMLLEILRRYSIPEPVTGGFLGMIAVSLAYFVLDIKIVYELEIRDWLLLYFFSAIGLRADIRTLLSGGRPLLILLLLSCSYIILQNLAGMGIASVFGMNPKTGLRSAPSPSLAASEPRWRGPPPSLKDWASPTPWKSGWPPILWD